MPVRDPTFTVSTRASKGGAVWGGSLMNEVG